MSNAQIHIELNANQVKSIDDLWQLTIGNGSDAGLVVDAQVTVFGGDDETEFYKGYLSNIQLLGGQHLDLRAHALGVDTKLLAFPMDSLTVKVLGNNQVEGLIPKGDYVQCVSIFTHDTGLEIQRECRAFSASNSYMDSIIKQELDKFTIRTLKPSVQVESFTYFDIIDQEGSTVLKHRNSGIYVTPTVTIKGFPLSASFFLDTDSDQYYNSASTFQLQLDTYAYKATLAERLKATIAGESGALGEAYANAAAIFDEKAGLENLLQTPEVASLLGYADSVEFLSQYASDTALRSVLTEQLAQLSDTAYLESMLEKVDCDSTAFHAKVDSSRAMISKMQDSVNAKIDAVKDLAERAIQYKAMLDRNVAIDSLIAADTTISKYYEQYQSIKAIDVSQYTDPTYITGKLKSIDKISKLETIVSGVDAFQIGMSSPVFSEFTMSGVLLNGLQVAYDFGRIKVVTADGRINDNSTLFSFDRFKETYSKLYSAGCSYELDSNFTYSVYVLASDFKDVDTLSWYNFLESNNVLSQTIVGSVLHNRIEVKSEFALSYAKNNDFTEPNGTVPSGLGSVWIVDAIAQKDRPEIGSFADKAASIELTGRVDHDKTTLHIASRYLGAGYYTPGNPFLINDLVSIEGGAARNFWKNRIQADVSLIRNRDNVSDVKETTTSYYNVKAHTRISVPKFPTITLDYLPNVIINEDQQIQVTMLSGSAQYPYALFGKVNYLTGSCMDVRTENMGLEALSNYASRVYMLTNSCVFEYGEAELGWNANNTISAEDSIYFQTINLGYTYHWKENLVCSASVQSVTEDGWQSISPGFQIDVQGSPLKNLTLRAGYYYLPVSDIYFITGSENIGNQTTYMTISYNF